jgi:hypothetical protein
MTLRFAIRDDDICFHTDADELYAIYEDITALCPVSLSCIPFVGGYDVDRYTPEKWAQFDLRWRDWQTKEVYPLGENPSLVNLLRKWCDAGQATLMLHGIHHDLYEFTQTREFTADIGEAKRYMESLFGRPFLVASPPNNSLGPQATKGLALNGFDVLTAFGHRPNERPSDFRNYLNFLRLLALYFRHGKRFRLTRPLNFGTHREQPCYEIGPSTRYQDLVAGFEFALARGGNFVVATHHYHLADTARLRTMLHDLVVHAAEHKNEVCFVTAERLFETV